MADWTLNGTALDELGIRLVGGNFRTHAASRMRLEAVRDIDVSDILGDGAMAVLAVGEDVYFQGKVASTPKGASPDDEWHGMIIEDAWRDIEETIYQEAWAVAATSILLPKFVFGIGINALATDFERVSVGKMIENAVSYAISQGADLQLGSVPTGELPIPSEESNLTCGEVIRMALKLHPDWFPWIDHTTTPPTFNVTAAGGMAANSIDLTAGDVVERVDVVERSDMLPDSVRIIYELAATVDNEVYRDLIVEKYPAGGPDGGPKVLQAAIPLAGMEMQIQKSRVQTRTIPTSAEHADAKKFLIANQAQLSGVDEEAFEVDDLTIELVTDEEDHPDPINPNAPRLVAADVDDLPRQLVRGQLEDWMRLRAGKVKIKATISPACGATAEQKSAIQRGTIEFVVTGTNAQTKVYRGISQWVAPEDVPEGLAQATYDAIHASMKYEGSVTLADVEVPTTRYIGKKLNLSNGQTAWASMGAPVYSVDFDVDAGKVTIGFGPVPFLAPQDFLEMQRILRWRPVRWWSTEERGSNKLGGEDKPSAKGDTVTGYEAPEIIPGLGDPPVRVPFGQRSIREDGGGYAVAIWPGVVVERLTSRASAVEDKAVKIHKPEMGGELLDACPSPEITMSEGDYLIVRYPTDKTGTIDDTVTVEVADNDDGGTHYQPTDSEGEGGVDGDYKVVVGKLVVTGDVGTLEPYQTGHIEHYHDLPTHTNKGGEKIAMGPDEDGDKYEFRGIEANYGLEVDPQDEKLVLDVDAESIGTGSAVLVPPEDPEALEDGPLQFRTVRPLYTDEVADTPAQIQVDVADGEGSTEGAQDTIRIHGNGNNGTLTFLDCDEAEVFSLEWIDGLITVTGEVPINLGSCDSRRGGAAPPP